MDPVTASYVVAAALLAMGLLLRLLLPLIGALFIVVAVVVALLTATGHTMRPLQPLVVHAQQVCQ